MAATAVQAELLLRLPPAKWSESGQAETQAWVAELQASGTVGVIALATVVPDPVLLAAENAGLPVVAIDPIDTTDSRVVSIGSTNWAGGRSAAEHVIALGHRRIAWIGGPRGSAPSAERFHGYQAALDSAGIPPDRGLIHRCAFSVEAGLNLGREIMALPEPPTAIVAGNDEIAVGVLVAAKERHVVRSRRFSPWPTECNPPPGTSSSRRPSASATRQGPVAPDRGRAGGLHVGCLAEQAVPEAEPGARRLRHVTAGARPAAPSQPGNQAL